MDLEIVKNQIMSLKNHSSSKTSLYFIEKIKAEGDLENYLAYQPSLRLGLQKEIIDIICPSIDKLSKKEQHEYNENGRVNGIIEFCSSSYIGDLYTKLTQSLIEDNQRETMNKDDKKDFYCIEFKVDTNESIYILNRIPQFKKFSKGIWGTLVDSTFEKASEVFIGIEPNFDLIIYQGEIVVVNNISLQRIFDLKSKYIENANNILTSFEESNKIEGFELFKSDSIEDGNIVKRISKLMMNPERMERFVSNFNKVGEIITEFDLNIELNDDKTKIVYTDKKQLNDIVKLLNDAYYKTVLSGEKGVDELR